MSGFEIMACINAIAIFALWISVNDLEKAVYDDEDEG
jgi:hypothetical protein